MNKPYVTILEVANLWHGPLMIFSGYLALTAVGIMVGVVSWKWIKEKVFLYFSIYLTTIMLTAIFAGFLVGQGPLPEEYLADFRFSVFLAVLTNYSCFLFIRELISPQKNFPKLYKLLVGTLALLTAADFYAFYMANAFSWNLRGQILMVFTVFNLIVQFRAAVTMRFVRWYIAGIISFLLSVFPFALLNSGVISEFTPVTASIPFVGVLLQTVLFLIGLLDRLRYEYERNIAETRFKLLGEAAGEIFHELVSPLNIIMASGIKLKDLTSRFVNPSAIQQFEEINERIDLNIQRVGANIDRFRHMTMAPMDETRKERVLASKVIAGAMDLAELRVERKGCKILIEDEVSASVWVEGNLFDFEQVFANLLINSADAVQGLSERWVKIKTQVVEDFIEVDVIDSGNGIPQNLKHQIFAKFFTTKSVGEGSGLGLYFSRTIIEKYGGSIELKDGGPHTCFTVRLPVA